MLGVTYKSAWFMTHRIREAMKPGSTGLMGTGGGTVEADETYWGNQGKQRTSANAAALVQHARNGGGCSGAHRRP